MTHRDVLRAYADRLQHTVHEAAAQPSSVVPTDSELRAPLPSGIARLEGYRVIDLRLAGSTPPVGQPVADATWPPGTVLIAIRRDDEWITVSEATVLAQGDRLTLLVPADHEHEIDELVASASEPG